jgi:hypothetical protein
MLKSTEVKDFFNRLDEITRKKLEESKIPQTGIFWYYKGNLIGINKHDYKEPDDNSYDSLFLHLNYWDKLFEIGDKEVTSLPNELKDDYTSVPRGRVEYYTDKDQFVVWGGERKTPVDIFNKVKKEFNLPDAKTKYEYQSHYYIMKQKGKKHV